MRIAEWKPVHRNGLPSSHNTRLDRYKQRAARSLSRGRFRGHHFMFFFQQPSEVQIANYLAGQVRQAFSYDSVACTREQPVARRGWNIDQHRVLLGCGRDCFDDARAAIDAWRMFPSGLAE